MELIQFDRKLATFDQQITGFVKALVQEAQPILADVPRIQNAVEIIKSRGLRSAEDNAECLEVMKLAADSEKAITGYWEPTISAANKLHKSLTGARSEMAAPVAAAKTTMSRLSGEYQMQVRRVAEAAQAELQRVAELERRRLEKEAREKRAEGLAREAKQLEATAAAMQAPILDTEALTVEGTRNRVELTAECVDIMPLLAAIVGGQVPLMQEDRKGEPRPLVILDQVVLNAVLFRMGKTLNWPGIVVREQIRPRSMGK